MVGIDWNIYIYLLEKAHRFIQWSFFSIFTWLSFLNKVILTAATDMSLRKVAMWVTVAGPREQARLKKTLRLGWKGCVFGAFVEGTNWRIRCLLKGGVLLIALHLVHVTRALQWCFDDDEDDDDIPPLQTPEVTTRWLSRGIRGILPKWPWIWVWMIWIYSKSPTCSTHNASDYSSSLQLQMGSDCPPMHHQDFML